MPEKKEHVVADDDVFALTAQGKTELQGARTSLSPPELEVLVLIDGKSTAGETAERARTLGIEAVRDILGRLFAADLVELVKDQGVSLDFVDFFQPTGPVTASAAANAKAQKQAAATASLLQEAGYSVRIARRPKSARNVEETQVLSVLVIDDEPHLCDLIKHILTAEGFQVRIAKNREEIVAELRRPPRPDLVLLDVLLPDVNGFDVLSSIRRHPALKAITVVMLTGQATRAAVLKGLLGGADGYITKPFRIEVLTKAISAVLGLPGHEKESSEKQDLWDL